MRKSTFAIHRNDVFPHRLRVWSRPFPLIREWLSMGMSMVSAATFMLIGQAAKNTNLGALKIMLGAKRFALYIAFVLVFSLVTGLVIDLPLDGCSARGRFL